MRQKLKKIAEFVLYGVLWIFIFCMIVALKEPHGPLDYFDPEYANPYAGVTFPPPQNMTAASFQAMPQCVREGLNGSDAGTCLKDTAQWQKDMRKIYGYISRADVAVGRIMRALRESGLDDNTVAMHISDNGSFVGAHGLVGKWMMYEESIRVPLIVRDPRVGPEGRRRRRKEMALNIDVAPTVLSMAGVDAPAGMQGLDLRPFLKETGAAGREEWYYEHTFATAKERGERPIPASEGVRTRRWKYIRYTSEQPVLEQLFDLEADPHEEQDLAREPDQAARLKEMRAKCDEYRTSLA